MLTRVFVWQAVRLVCSPFMSKWIVQAEPAGDEIVFYGPFCHSLKLLAGTLLLAAVPALRHFHRRPYQGKAVVMSCLSSLVRGIFRGCRPSNATSEGEELHSVPAENDCALLPVFATEWCRVRDQPRQSISSSTPRPSCRKALKTGQPL